MNENSWNTEGHRFSLARLIIVGFMMQAREKSNHNKKPCLFCIWAEDLEEAQRYYGKKAKDLTVIDMAKYSFTTTKNKPWKLQFLKANEHFFAVLSLERKVEGHTLIISREHFRGITDSKLANLKNEVKIAFFNIMTEMVRQLKCITRDKQQPKVYAMSICEHWTPKELSDAGKSYHTEHLHFHLLPRIKAMRTRYPHHIPEAMFERCDRTQSNKELEKVRQKILNSYAS